MRAACALLLLALSSGALSKEVCWRNPSQNVDGSALTDLTEVMLYWAATPLPAGCRALAQCSAWPTGNFLKATTEEGVVVCVDAPLPPVQNHIVATARAGTGAVSVFSNLVVRAGDPAPPVGPLPPLLEMTPSCASCTRSGAELFIGSTMTPVTFSFAAAALPVEIRIRKFSTGSNVARATLPAGSSSWIWTPARPGLYYAVSRSCPASGCPEWAGREAQGALFLIELPPASGGTIE